MIEDEVSYPEVIPWANRIITVKRSFRQQFQKQRITVTQSWTKETFQELYFNPMLDKVLSKSSCATEGFEFARHMLGSVLCFDVYDKAFAYFTGGMNPSRILSKQAIQLYHNQSMQQDDTYKGVMVHPEMPEPRTFHAAICLDAS